MLTLKFSVLGIKSSVRMLIFMSLSTFFLRLASGVISSDVVVVVIAVVTGTPYELSKVPTYLILVDFTFMCP